MENVPKETETIAHKTNLRIAEKLKAAKGSFNFKKAWWTNGPVEFLSVFLVFGLNLVMIFPFFGKPANSMSFSGPIVPLLAKGITLFKVPFPYAIQIVNIAFFLAFPLTFYFFVRGVGGRKFSAFLAILMASLPFTLFAKTRAEYGIAGTDAAFIASLTILPLALLGLLKFLKNGGMESLAAASLFATVTALISPFGFFVYLVTSLITTFSEFLLGTGRLKLLRLLSVYLLAGSFCSFWYNPVFFYWMITGPMGEGLRAMLAKLIPISLFVLPVLGCFGYLVFDRKPNLQPLFLALFYSIFFALIVFAGGGFVVSEEGRYLPVLGISLSFLFGILIVKLLEVLASHSKILFYNYGLKNMLLIAISFLMMVSIYSYKWLISRQGEKILGIWTDVQKGDIWIMNDVYSSRYSFIGDAITIFGICILTYLYINYRKVKKAALR